MCLASSDSLFLYSSHHPITATVGPMQGDLSICIPPAPAAPDNSTWKNKAEMYRTLDFGVCLGGISGDRFLRWSPRLGRDFETI